jgi:TerC family integral membrane protein
MDSRPLLWIVFGGLVLALLAIDVFILNRRAHVLTVKEALRWTALVVTAALAFGVTILLIGGGKLALEYYAGYLIELSLSVDNLFVFLLIFEYFAVPAAAQPRVLSWGIFGAMVLRGGMILLGTMIVTRYQWVIFVFGAILLVTAVRMYREQGIRIDPEKNPLFRLCRRIIPVSDSYRDHRASGDVFRARGRDGPVRLSQARRRADPRIRRRQDGVELLDSPVDRIVALDHRRHSRDRDRPLGPGGRAEAPPAGFLTFEA